MKIIVTHKEEMKFNANTGKENFEINAKVISPLEYFLAGMITCSATDMIALPKNQGFDVTDLEVSGEVVRAEEHPRKFTHIHLNYSFNCTADETTAARWVMASTETYCSTINTVRDTSKITYTIVYNGKTIRENEEMISGQGSNIDLGEIEACCS